MSKQIIIECVDCDATGIYKGWCEKDGAGVVCKRCNGSGFIVFKYTPFSERKLRTDVKRVYNEIYYIISDKDANNIHFSQYGCTYNEWLNGATPKPIEELECPMLATIQEWRECPMIKRGEWIGYIPDCKERNDKKECWRLYHESQK